MAAHYWRLLLVCEMGFAIAMAALARGACNTPPALTALAGLGGLLLFPCVLVGSSFLVARFIRSSKHYPEGCTEVLHAWVHESIALERVALAMSVEPWRRFQYEGSRG